MSRILESLVGIAKMLEDVYFSEFETKIIAVGLDTLRKAGVRCKGILVDVLKRIEDEEY